MHIIITVVHHKATAHRVCVLVTLTFIEFRYIRTSSNCLKRKKQEAMHCLPGIVSTRNDKHALRAALRGHNDIKTKFIRHTAFAC